MSNQSSKNGNAVGLPAILLVVFVVLKLTHVIEWSWWWVLSPLWIPLAFALVVLLVATVVLAATKKGRL
jgi:membrane protein YdbS with pleckstrin-like domain